MQIDIQGVKITLTKKQLSEIAKQTQKYKIEDIDYSLACKILNEKEYKKEDFIKEKHWITEQLETIIKAVNYIDNNNQLWEPDFLNNNQYKYYNWFEKNSSGWFLVCVYFRFSDSCYSGGLYFKNKDSARIIANKHIDLYSQYLG